MIHISGEKHTKHLSPKLTHPVIATIVYEKKATLYEIENLYDIDQVLQLYELAVFSVVNKYYQVEELKYKK